MKKFMKKVKKSYNNYINWVTKDWYGIVTYWLACFGLGCIIRYIIETFKKLRGH